jgi:hypothetical protein
MMAEKKTEMPSREELGKLPRWTIVAFAARCARRVQPLFKALWPKAPAKHCKAVEGAIRLAEFSAATGRVAAWRGATWRATGRVATRRAATWRAPEADYAAFAAYVAANAAIAADAAPDAARAAYAAVHAATPNRAGGKGWRDAVVRATRVDIEKVKTAAKKERWTDETPVPPEFFGPLWPEGEPAGWPSARIEADEPITGTYCEQPSIDLYVDPGDASTETIQEVLAALSDLHVAAGGLGLEFKSDGHFVHAVERIPR